MNKDFNNGLIIGLSSAEVLDNLILYRGEVKKDEKVKTSVYIVKNTIIEEDMKDVSDVRDINIDEDLVLKEGNVKEVELSETITTENNEVSSVKS